MPLSLLHSAARAGTRRLALASIVPSLQAHPSGQALLGALNQANAPDALRLLRAAAVSCVLHRAQWHTRATDSKGSSAPPESRPALQEPTIVQAMHELLNSPEATISLRLRALRLRLRLLRSMQEIGQRLPPALLLPSLANHAIPRALLVPVLGTRGRWLAQLGNPEWTWANDGTPLEEMDGTSLEDIWQRGGTQQRLALLQSERHTEPARARQRLEQGLGPGGALSEEARERLFVAMARNVSMQDEPFLERCLKDRSDFVQTFAAELLSTLPRSRHSQRICAALLTLVQRATGGQWQLALPQKFEAAWARDGVLQDGPGWSSSLDGYPHTWWLQQLVSFAPLSFWQEADLPPQHLRGPGQAERDAAVQAGWLKAALLAMQAHQNVPAGWLDTILSLEANLYARVDMESLLRRLDGAQREGFWRAQLQYGTRPLHTLIGEMEETLQIPGRCLSSEFSRSLVQHMAQALAANTSEEATRRLLGQLNAAVCLLHGSALADFAAWWQGMERASPHASGLMQIVPKLLRHCEKLHQCEQAMEALAA